MAADLEQLRMPYSGANHRQVQLPYARNQDLGPGAPSPFAVISQLMNAITHLPLRWSQTVRLWSQEVRATVTLAVPLMLIELAWVAMVTTDTVMMGWLGPESLAAGSLAGQFFLFFEYFAIGVLAAVAPILSQHLGARRFATWVRRIVRPRILGWVAMILALPCVAIIWHAQAILVLLGQNPDLASAGQSYVRFMALAAR